MILLLSFCFSANFCTHHLGELVKYEEFDDEIIVYETVGVAAQDLVAAKVIYDKALEAGKGMNWG